VDRAERIYYAMLSRGFGRYPESQTVRIAFGDLAFLARNRLFAVFRFFRITEGIGGLQEYFDDHHIVEFKTFFATRWDRALNGVNFQCPW
jgi:hypothetical protein